MKRLMQRNKQVKDQLDNNIKSKKQEFIDTVKEDVQHFKREKEDQKELLEYQKREEYLRNTSKKQMIKNNQKEAVEKRERDVEEKKLNAKRQLIEKITRENQMRIEKEQRVAELEREELNLIQNLQNTQLLQKAAYDELEKALETNDGEF
jgi:hypothetical protein